MSKTKTVPSAVSTTSHTAVSTAPPLVSDHVLNMVGAMLLAAAIGTLYFRVADAPFIFDDEVTIQTNASLRQLWPLWGEARHPGPLNPGIQMPTSGRPLVNLSFALNYAWGGLEPTGYRVVNMVIHVLAAILLMLIVRRTLRSERFAGRFDRVAGPLALLVALLWAVHPLQTEAVAYVTQRTELLMALFFLATLYCAQRCWTFPPLASRVVPDPGPTRAMWLALAILACAAGMACKEVMVTVPLVVLLYEWTFTGRSLRDIARESWPLYVGLAATWLLLLYLNVGGPRSVSTGFDANVSPWTWWSTQAKIFWMYLKLAVWPWPLVIHYRPPLLDTWQTAAPWVLVTLLLLGTTFALLWQRHPIGFVAACVMIILSPTSIVPIYSEFAAERRMYLPLAPLMALAVVGGYILAQKLLETRKTIVAAPSRRPLAAVSIVAIVLVLVASLLTTRRLDAYSQVTPLWEDALIHQPDNYVVNYNLAVCLMAEGRVEEAFEVARRTVETWPHRWRAHLLVGKVLNRMDRTDEAIASFETAVHLKPESFESRLELGSDLSDSGRYDEAIVDLEAASRLDPSDVRPQYLWGLALSKAGRLTEAVEHYETALKLDADHFETRNNLGVALVKLGRMEEAKHQFQRAVELAPDYAEAQSNLARLQDQAGNLPEAIEHYEEVLRIRPGDFEIHNKLASAYVRSNQPAKAIAIAEKAADLARAAGQAAAAEQIQSWLREYRVQPGFSAAPSSSTDSPSPQALPKRDSTID